MTGQDTLESRVKYLQELRLQIKSRQRIDSSDSVIFLSYGAGGTSNDTNPNFTIFIPEYDYKLVRIVWTPSITPVPYAEIDVKTNISLSSYDSTTHDVYPDPDAATRSDRMSWIFFASTYQYGGFTATLKAQVRATVSGVVSYEVIR